MNTIVHQLTKIISDTYPDLKSITEIQADEKPYPEKWSIKEILGHLIDYAANINRIVSHFSVKYRIL